MSDLLYKDIRQRKRELKSDEKSKPIVEIGTEP